MVSVKPAYHIWDRGSIILEMNDSGEVINRFSRGVGHLIHSYHHGFYLFNAKTDVVQRVDSNGDILHTYRYDEFSNQLKGMRLILIRSVLQASIATKRLDLFGARIYL